MSPVPSAPRLMRALGLEVDGPVRWGQQPGSRQPGIFVVETPAPSPAAPIDHEVLRQWLARVPALRLDGEEATATSLARRLASFWVPDASLLYVGRTSRSLAGRVAALYATGLGYRRPHAGGHWLKTLKDHARLHLWWAETPAGEEYEDALIEAFVESLPVSVREALASPVLPWANLTSTAGLARATGLESELLDAEAQPRREGAVRRSEASGTPTRRVPRSAVAATPAPRRGVSRSSGGRPSAKRDEPTPVTAEGLAAMEIELERLRSVERPAVVARIVHARELGDLRENADYEAARREQSFLEGRIQELEARLRTAVVIRSGARGGVALGSRVRYEVDGEPGELTIVGSTEADPGMGRVSAVSPVGRALMGRRAGDEVEVVTPSRRLSYRIVEVT